MKPNRSDVRAGENEEAYRLTPIARVAIDAVRRARLPITMQNLDLFIAGARWQKRQDIAAVRARGKRWHQGEMYIIEDAIDAIKKGTK